MSARHPLDRSVPCRCDKCEALRRQGGNPSIGDHRALHWPRWALWALMSGSIRAGGRNVLGNPRRTRAEEADSARRMARDWYDNAREATAMVRGGGE